jgi:flavin-dependent dehydrogenase
MTSPTKTDVVVVGAGTAGAAAAWHCASRGLRVTCLERRPLSQAGARWVNGVALWQLDEAGVPRPEGAEVVGGVTPFHLVAGWGPERVVVTDHEVADLDMRALVARLQGLAQSAGADLIDDVETRDFDGRTLRTSAGDFEADVFVDASGLRGARLMQTPSIDRTHICAAAQAVHGITDVAAARAYFAEHAVPEGEVLCFTGIEGGYSILNVRMHGDEVAILTGSVPGDGHASGKAILDRFVAQHDWVGTEKFGGWRTIPIRRPRDRLVEGRVALVGDAASQVFPAHGSGIAQGMIAARHLAEAIANGRPPIDYAVRYQRKWGALLAGYDVFRRYSQQLSADEVRGLMTSDLFDASTSAAGMSQRWPSLDPAAGRAKATAAAHNPQVAARLLKVLSKMGAVTALYRAYPPSHDRRLRVWSRAVATVMREPPDVA